MASPEGKKGTLQSPSSSSSSDQRQSNNNNNNNNHGTSPHHQNNSSSTTPSAAPVSLIKTPVIRHRDADARVTIRGWLYKQGSDGLQLWKKRWFVLSQFCLFYYHGPEEEKVLGSLLLPSYTIRPCLVGDRDRVYRKYAFKAEHRNTRSFYLAAESRPSMIQWMNALSLAAILQDPESASASPSSSSAAANATINSNNSNNRSFDDHQPQLQAQHPSTAAATGGGGYRQPLYANAPPKPRRLNTSRDSPSCSSSPDRSPDQSSAAASSLSLVSSQSAAGAATPTSSGAMYGNQGASMMVQQQQLQPHPGVWPPYQQRLHQQHQQQRRPVSAEVSTLLQQQQQRLRNSPQMQIPAERRTPDAYGRFKTEYEDVYNNSSTASSSNASSSIPQATTTATTPTTKGTKSPAAALVVTHRSEVARRVPPRPHSVDILQQQQHLQQQQRNQTNDYWASEENYAQQVRQSSVLRNFPSPLASASSAVVRDPAEISRDVKESALWSYVQSGQSNQQQQTTTTPVRPVLKRVLSNSQENLLTTTDDGDDQLQQQQLFKRSASARLPRPVKQSPPPLPPLLAHQQNSETLNSSLSSSTDNQPEMDNRRYDQREESMKRLLEWKQRMLQSPLTRKGGGGSGGGSGTRSSERSTPTQMLVSAGSERDASSPMQHRQLHLQPHHISSLSPAAIPSPVLPVQQQQHSTGGTSPVQAAVVATTATVATSSMSSAAAHTSQMINGIKVAYHQSGLTAAGSRVTTSLVKSLQPAPSRPHHPPPPSALHHYHHPSQNKMTQGFNSSSRGYNDEDDNMMRPVKKGKLPLMIGHDQPSSGGGVGDNGIGGCSRLATQDHNKVLSAGDLLGRTHEELVLLLIQLRRQSSALVKARDACLLEMESQVKLASLDVNHRQECLVKTAELKHHVKELEKQLEKLKPLISLVDNMVKLGSSSSSTSTANVMRLMTSPALQHRQQQQRINKSPETSTAVKRNLTPLLHQQQQIQKQLHHLQQQQQQHSFTASPPTYSNVHPHHQQQFHQQSPVHMNNNNNNTIVFHSTPLRGSGGMELPQGWEEAQISQLESKHHQLAQLEKFVREEGMAIEKLTRNQQVLRLAINGVRQQAAGAVNFAEVEHCRQQQMFLERELGQIHSLLALSSKRLEDAAVEISRIEQEISVLHQQLHRVNAAAGRLGPGGHNSLSRSSSAATAAGGREMIWLQAELDRVQQHVSQLQTRRIELSSQVNRLTSSGDYLIDLDASAESWSPLNNSFNQRKTPSSSANNSTWCETDMDSLNTIDRTSSAMYANTSMAPAVYHDQQHRYYHHEQHEEEEDDGMMLMDINEADERMKRYYGIPSIPNKQQQQSAADKEKAEIRTVRIVKRESEKRQRDKTNRRSPYDDMSGSFMDELTESGDEQPPPIPPPPSNGDYYNNGHGDPIMDDPVLSQFSHVLTLPRNSKRASVASTSSQRNSLALSTTDIRQQSGRPVSMGPDQWRSSLRPRRNLASLTLSDRTASSSMSLDGQQTDEELLGSLDSTQRSPVLTPVYTSDAAREIVEEMRRQDMMTARRAVPRHKRRHITISCSQPLALEALSPQSKTQRVNQGRARDDVDLQRALRSLHHPFAPDVVRSTINHAIRINEKTIDKILSAPDKIVIPERYVPEQEVEEVGEEEKQRRLKKTESIKRMLTGHGAVTELPRPPSIAATNDIMELSTAEAKELLAKERQQRDHFISLNQMLVEEIKEKSKMAAAAQNMSMDNGQYVA